MIRVVLKERLDYHEISPEISESTAVWPGDAPFKRAITLDFRKGDSVLVAQLQGSAHVGAHADAPKHYHPDGAGIGERPLRPYLGPAQVISVRLPRGARIMPADIAATEIVAERALFKTGSFPDPRSWNDDFNSLSPELVDYLADRGVILAGIDTPSVDPAESKALESHQAVYRRDLAILEGIVLDGVPDGVYGLVALPLRIRGGDASWVRAILIKE